MGSIVHYAACLVVQHSATGREQLAVAGSSSHCTSRATRYGDLTLLSGSGYRPLSRPRHCYSRTPRPATPRHALPRYATPQVLEGLGLRGLAPFNEGGRVECPAVSWTRPGPGSGYFTWFSAAPLSERLSERPYSTLRCVSRLMLGLMAHPALLCCRETHLNAGELSAEAASLGIKTSHKGMRTAGRAGPCWAGRRVLELGWVREGFAE